MRILDFLRPSSEYLERSGIDESLSEAEILVFDASGMDRLDAYVNNPEIDRKTRARITRLLERRAKGEPLQYILGHVDFLGLRIQVGRGLLIPRPETELLVQEAIQEVRGMGREGKGLVPRVLDLCTGSGCIALALAREFPNGEVCAADISETAIAYAGENALANGIRNVSFFCGSLFEPVREMNGFDLIISNPPYIKTSDIAGLQREVREWEPLAALDGGKDGLDFYRKIFLEAAGCLTNSGIIMLELGFGQSGAVSGIAGASGFRKVTIKKDYAGIDRVMKAER